MTDQPGNLEREAGGVPRPSERDALQDELRSLGLRPSGFVRRPAQPPGFEVLRELSRGGQGIVYEAIQRSTGRRVALKVGLARELPGSDENERFRREVQLLASLHHAVLPTVYESGIAEGWRWLAMEFVEGVDLTAWAQRTRPSRRRIVELCSRICEGVGLAHRHGIVHRDLKPSNILIDGTGKPVVLDFGLAKRFSAGGDAPDVTRAGAILGSPLWLAPEQIHSPEDVGPRADVYALGRVLYFLLSGAHPYPGDPRETQWLRDVRDLEPLPLRRVAGPDADPVLEAIVMKAVEREPALRYADADALRADCVAWLAGAATVARPGGRMARLRRHVRRRPRRSAAVAIAALTVIAAASGWWMGAPTRWEQRVRAAIREPGSRSLTELWKLHLDAPGGVERAGGAVGGAVSGAVGGAVGGVVPGPLRTHYALLARYLAEPCTARIALPRPERTDHRLRTAPRGDVVIVELPAVGGRPAEFWLGRDPDYAWLALDVLDGAEAWQLSEDGRYLAGRAPDSAWRLWELDGGPGVAAPRELAWSRDSPPRELAFAWQAHPSRTPTGARPGEEQGRSGGEAVVLTRGPRSEWQLARAGDGERLVSLPRLTATLAAAGPLERAALGPEGRWLALASGSGDSWILSLAEPETPAQHITRNALLSMEFLDSETLALDTGAVRLLGLGAGGWDDFLSAQFLFATENRSPVWVRNSELVVRSTVSALQFLPRGARDSVVDWSTTASPEHLYTVRERGVLITHDRDGYLSRWDVSQDPGGAIVPPWRRAFPGLDGAARDGSAFGIAFSPDGGRVAVSQISPPRVRVRGLRGTEPARELVFPDGDALNSLAWSRTGPERLAIAGGSGRVYLWSPDAAHDSDAGGEPGELGELVLYGELGGGAHAVALSPDGRYLLAGGQAGPNDPTGRIRVWRVGEPGSPVRTLERAGVGRVTSLTFAEGGRWLVAGTANSNQLQWLEGPLTGEFVQQDDHAPARDRVTRDVDALGAGVVSVHRDGMALRYTERGSGEGAGFDELGSQPFTVAAHPEGALVAVGAADGRVHLLSFDGEAFALVASIPFPSLRDRAGTQKVFRVRFSPDGRYLVVGGEIDTVPCWLDLEDAERCLAGNLEWAVDELGGAAEPRDAGL